MESLTLYSSDLNCKGASLVFPAREHGTEANIPDNHNDKLSSFACFTQ